MLWYGTDRYLVQTEKKREKILKHTKALEVKEDLAVFPETGRTQFGEYAHTLQTLVMKLSMKS